MTLLEQVAEQLVDKFLDDHCVQLTSSPPTQHPLDAHRELTAVIVTALREVEAATEQRVWEAAANEALRSYPDDAIAKKISPAIHRRAAGGTP